MAFLKYISITEFCYAISYIVLITIIKLMVNKILLKNKKLQNLQKFISIYEAILTSADECWIAFTKSGNIVGYSEKVKSFLKNSREFNKENISDFLIEEHREIFKLNLEKLIENGESFKIICNGEVGPSNLSIYGSRFIIKGVVTNCIWIKDLTDFINEKNVINTQLKNAIEIKKSFEQLMNYISIPLWVRDRNFKLEFCNQVYADIVEKDINDVVSGNIPLVNGDAFGNGDSLARNADKTGKKQQILQNIIVNGVRKKYEITEIPDNGKIIGYGLDKTDKYDAIRELDRYVKAHGDVLEMLSTAVAIFNSDTKLIFFNTAYQKLTSIEEGWLHANPKFGEILDEMRRRRKLPEVIDFSQYKKEKLNLFTSLCNPAQELEYLPDGRTLRVVSSPYPLGGIIFMYEDVSDNLNLQRQKNTLLEVQKETIDHLYEGVAVYASDNKIKLFNPAFKKIWNIDDDTDLFGLHISEVMEQMKEYLNYGDDWIRYKESAIANLTDRIPKTGRMFRQNDTVVNFSYLPLPDGSHVHSYIDVTASWVVEKALYEKNKALEEAEHVKSEFISNISTDLRSYVDKILNVPKTDKCIIDKVFKYAKELDMLITDLTDLASIEAGTIDVSSDYINLYDLLSNITNVFVRLKEGKNVDLNFTADKSINIIGDEKRLRQIILNVLNIAFNDDKNKKLEINVKSLGGHIEISISYINMCFNTESEKDVKQLPVIKGIIELHGGKIVKKEGSDDFTFVLPIADEKQQANLGDFMM